MYLLVLEAIIQVTSTESKTSVPLNSFVNINVQFSQTPVSVTWVHRNFNGSQTTITLDENHFYESPFTVLIIFAVGRYDLGFYDCFASDGVDNYHLAIPILLCEAGTPSVESSMTSLDIDPRGQTLELDCTYTDSHVPSDPSMEPDVRWLHCDISHICSRIDKGNTLKYSGSNVTHPSLTIHLYAEDDFGSYWCQVENELGTSSSHVIKLTGTVNTMVETTTTTTTIPDSIPTPPDSITTPPDSTTTITIPDSTTTTLPDSTTTTPDSTTTTIPDSTATTTKIPDSTTTTPDSRTTTLPETTTATTIPDSTLTSIFITSENVTTGQCGGYNRDEKAIFIQYAGAKSLTGRIEDKMNIRSSIRCALYCLQCDNCNGYNYQKATGSCQLLQSSLSNYIISSSWNFYSQHI
ncbi:Hypothetical predicted protein [Mytilus galloprovincialis]|uniref:Ig-like domain-containing protein n=1 Tax=Mytilus galloprovincialis TaxID=29158 RepID=A0A8B6CPL8_MYTGA|nr:Hypothetical predicted protein [Mytilus galloprovincialis]